MEKTPLLPLPEGMLIDQIETHRKWLGHSCQSFASYLLLSTLFRAIVIHS